MMDPTGMQVVSPAMPMLDDDELALYWDTRYGRYFYAGIMTPPTGQLYDFRGRPITYPSDTHTWSVVKLEKPDPNDSAPPPGPSILSRPAKKGEHQRRSKDRRVKWNFLAEPAAAPEDEQSEDNRGWELPNMLRYVVCPLLLAVLAGLVALVWFGVLLPGSGGGTPQSDMDDAPYTTDPGMIVRAWRHEHLLVSLPPLRRRAAVEDTPELGRPHSVDLPIDLTAQDSPVQTTNYILTTADVPYFDAAVTASSAIGSPGDLEIKWDVCLVASSESTVGHQEGNSSLWESHQRCYALVRCCYSLPANLSIEDALTARSGWSTEVRASRTSMLLGVHVGDDVAFQSLLGSRRGARAKFLLDVIEAAQTGRFSGVRLWVPPQGHVTSVSTDRLVSLARDVATELRGRNYTFGFFLPQGRLSEQWGVTIAELTNALDDAPYSLLLYPEFSAFWNTTGSTTAAWPTPEEVVARASAENGEMNWTTSVCYLSPPPAAVQVRLAKRCDANKTQLVSNEARLTFPTRGDVRRSLRDDDSWVSSARRYYTYACKGKWALLYQTPRQARQFHDDLFGAAPSSTCLGSFLEALPHVSDEIGSESGQR